PSRRATLRPADRRFRGVLVPLASGTGWKPVLLSFCAEGREPQFGGSLEGPFASAPGEAERLRVERVVGEDERGALSVGEAALDEVEVTTFVTAVEFVADDGMA